jgi:N-acylneuraminate cytidylyltransferase
VIYIGNDLVDLPAMKLAGWPVAVADARSDVKRAARVVTQTAGGGGVLREVAGWLTVEDKTRD